MALHQLALEAENKSENTRYFYRLALDRYSQFLKVTGNLTGHEPTIAVLSTPNVRAFAVWLRAQRSENRLTGGSRPVGAKTVREYVSALKSFAHWLVAEELLDVDPLARVQLPKAPEPLIQPFSAADCQAMLLVIDGGLLAERNRALLYLLADTGLRASEVCNLTRANLDLSGVVRVLGKGQKWRQLSFARTTGRVLARYLVQRGNMAASDRIFLTREGEPLRRQQLYKLVHEWGIAAGIPAAHPHRFRHAYAIAFLRAHPGALLHLQQNLGHSSLEMTRRYARLAETEAPLDGPSPAQVLLGGRNR
jgi:site-specific recombinase XerD